jgi:hypothetical protein
MVMAMVVGALLPLLLLLLHVHLLPPCKKSKEKKTHKMGQKGKFCNWGHSRKWKKGFYSILVKKRLVGSPIVVPL